MNNLQSELEFLYTQTPIMETDALNTTQPVRRVVDRPSRAGQAFGTNPNLKVASQLSSLE